MNYKFSYEEKIKLYEEALSGFRILNAGPWICNVLANLVRQRGMETGDSTSFCKENFPEFWEEVVKYYHDCPYPSLIRTPYQFPQTEAGDLLREKALKKAIDKCRIYLGLIPSTAAYGKSYPFIEEMSKYNWPKFRPQSFISMT